MQTAQEINDQLRLHDVYLFPGIYEIDKSIIIPSGRTLSAFPPLFPIPGRVKLIATTDDFPIITCENVHDIQISDLVLERVNPIGVNCHGIYIKGENIIVSNVSIINANSGVYLETHLTDYVNRNIKLENVTFTNDVADDAIFDATDCRQFGLLASSVNGLTVQDCHWSHAGLDGIKLRYNCYDIKITGGSSNKNGLKYGVNDKTKCVQQPDGRHDVGDGIDCFAGGRKVLIDGIRFEENTGNGITIKSIGGSLPGTSNEYCSFIEDYQIRNVVTNNNLGNGIAIEGVYDCGSIDYRQTTSNDIKYKDPILKYEYENVRPRASNILVENCSFNNDHGCGIFLNGISIKVNNCAVTGSCMNGVHIAENAVGIVLDNCRIISTCKIKNENDDYLLQGIIIEEKASGIIISNSLIDGFNPADPSAPLHQLGIYITQVEIDGKKVSANNVYILNCISIHNETWENVPAFIGSDPSSGYVYIQHSAPFDDPNGKIPAGLNSKFYSTTLNKTFIKTEDSVPDRRNGWMELIVASQ